MCKLLIIADDATGALDSAAQFARQGFSTKFILCPQEIEGDDTQVISLSTESRHMSPQAAYDTVYRIAHHAWQLGIRRIYKKTDSALRGCIGAELQAVLDASGLRQLPFLPAYPRIGRITVQNIHYCDGVPVSQSSVGRDPFDPVPLSDVTALLSMQTHVPVVPEGSNARGILLVNATEQKKLSATAQLLLKKDCWIAAGSAGLAEELALHMSGSHLRPPVPVQKPALFIFGSLHARSAAQAAALANYLPIFRVPQSSIDAAHCGNDIAMALQQHRGAILLSSIPGDNHIAPSTRAQVAALIGEAVRQTLLHGIIPTLMISGGDTLFSVLHSLRISHLSIIDEWEKCIVLSQADTPAGRIAVFSKAGSFGDDQTVLRLWHTLKGE